MKKFILLSLVAILSHIAIAYLLLPNIMQDQIDTYGMSEIGVKLGWALGMLTIFGIGAPVIISLISIIKKEFRNKKTIVKVYAISCCVCLIFNAAINIAANNI